MPKKLVQREPVVLVNVHDDVPAHADSDLAELAELAESAGCTVVGAIVQRKDRRGRGGSHGGAGPFLGEGKLDELAELCTNTRARVVVTRASLTPIQLRRMERRLPCRVIDRTGLILDIFAQRARSREGQLQVELAQLLYRLPRLAGKGEELSRLGGGLGTRGPGEQKLEYDRRRIRARVSRLKDEIEKLRQRRGHQRSRRQSRSLPSVVLVGYTNAGKTSLFNALTKSSSEARSHMFSTLDPQIRDVRLPAGGHALLSDTVGFIRDLPKDLRVAFRATFEEIIDADALIHVTDSSNAEVDIHIECVTREIDDLGGGHIPVLTVMNKSDALVHGSNIVHPTSNLRVVRTSAKTGDGLRSLLTLLEDTLRETFWQKVVVESPTPQIRAELIRMQVSVSETNAQATDDGPIEVWLTAAQAARIRAQT